MQTVLLAVKEIEEVIQTGEGGVVYVTADMFKGSIPIHDEVVITNNVAGSPTVVTYKLATVAILTITNTYDGSNFLTHSVRS